MHYRVRCRHRHQAYAHSWTFMFMFIIFLALKPHRLIIHKYVNQLALGCVSFIYDAVSTVYFEQVGSYSYGSDICTNSGITRVFGARGQ